MPQPDRATVKAKLEQLRGQIAELKTRSFGYFESTHFENWRAEVGRWLEAAGSPGEEAGFSFALIPWRGRDLIDAWKKGLAKADYLIGVVIENLENDWSGDEPHPQVAPVETQSRPAIQIVNQNVILNAQALTLEKVFEMLADVDDKKPPGSSGGGMRKKIREWLSDPTVKEYAGMTLDALFKAGADAMKNS